MKKILKSNITIVNNRCIDYGDGDIIVYEFDNPQVITKGSKTIPRGSNLINKTKEEKETNEERAARRAAKTIKDLVRSNNFNYWITLTLKDQSDSVDNFITLFNLWRDKVNRRIIRKHKGDMIGYILVLETHKSGAIHAHMFLKSDNAEALEIVKASKTKSGRDRLDRYGNTVYDMISWSYGYSTVINLSNNPKDVQLKIANYLTKYIVKEPTKIGKKGSRYLRSNNLLMPVKSINVDTSKFENSKRINSGVTVYSSDPKDS